MTVIKHLWFAFRMLLYPLRVTFYIVHRFIVFITKPGGVILTPAFAAGLILLFWGDIYALFDPIITRELVIVRDEFDPELYAAIYPIRIELTVLTLWGLGAVILYFISCTMRPFVGAFPPPTLPLMPHVPFLVPKYRVHSVRVRLAPRRVGVSRYDGNLDSVIRRMPNDIRDLLTRRYDEPGHYPGPTEITPSKAVWPPLAPTPVNQPANDEVIEAEEVEPVQKADALPAKAGPVRRTTRKTTTSKKGNPPAHTPTTTRRRKSA